MPSKKRITQQRQSLDSKDTHIKINKIEIAKDPNPFNLFIVYDEEGDFEENILCYLWSIEEIEQITFKMRHKYPKKALIIEKIKVIESTTYNAER